MKRKQLINQTDSQGRKQGPWEETNERGYTEKGHYVDGLREGLWKTYYKDYRNGPLLAEGHYLNGARHGVWKNYHSNGFLQGEGPYLNDKQHGVWKYYYKDGTLEGEAHYRNGKQHGVWKIYDDYGTLDKFRLYNMDKLIIESPVLILLHWFLLI